MLYASVSHKTETATTLINASTINCPFIVSSKYLHTDTLHGWWMCILANKERGNDVSGGVVVIMDEVNCLKYVSAK